MLLILKNRFSILFLASLFIGGSGFLIQESYGAAPTFTAIHNSTTTTEIIFSEVVNGTLNNQNWFINGIQATGATNGTSPSAAGNNYAATTGWFLKQNNLCDVDSWRN